MIVRAWYSASDSVLATVLVHALTPARARRRRLVPLRARVRATYARKVAIRILTYTRSAYATGGGARIGDRGGKQEEDGASFRHVMARSHARSLTRVLRESTFSQRTSLWLDGDPPSRFVASRLVADLLRR